jgi:hypothetical protein
MSSTLHRAFGARSLDRAERLLRKRWVQALLFAGVFVAAWLVGARTAHAALVG